MILLDAIKAWLDEEKKEKKRVSEQVMSAHKNIMTEDEEKEIRVAYNLLNETTI